MSRKDSHASRSSSKKARQGVPKSSACDGLQMAGALFEKLCANNGVSAHLTRYERSKNIEFNSPMSEFSNWLLCLTLTEERLAPRSRVCGYLDPSQSPHFHFFSKQAARYQQSPHPERSVRRTFLLPKEVFPGRSAGIKNASTHASKPSPGRKGSLVLRSRI
jgi:hypothetical protein